MATRIIIIVVSLLVVLTIAFFVLSNYTQSLSPADTAKINRKGLEVSVSYCKPSKKNRVIFGELVPFGKVWRTGANKSTTIIFNKDVKFGDKDLKAGTYSLFTIPEKDKWTIVINSSVGDWGAFFYDESKDVIRTTVDAKKTSSVVEVFNIDLKDSEDKVLMVLSWDDTEVAVPIQ